MNRVELLCRVILRDLILRRSRPARPTGFKVSTPGRPGPENNRPAPPPGKSTPSILGLYRPKTLLLSLSLGVYSALWIPMALVEGQFDRLFTWPMIVSAALILLVGVLLQAAANAHNDIQDFKTGVDTADRLGPQRLSRALPKARQGFFLWLPVGLAALCILAYIAELWILNALNPTSILSLLIILTFAALGLWGYSGGPLPISRTPLGELWALFFFGPFATASSACLIALVIRQPFPLGLLLYLLEIGLLPGFLIANVLLVNNMRDQHTDEHSGRFTLPVLLKKLGGTERTGAWVYLLFVILTVVFAMLNVLGDYGLSILLAGVLCILALVLGFVVFLKLRRAPLETFNALLGQSVLLAMLFSLLYGAILALI